MPEPQRTNGGSAEGGDSVSSFGLEHITEEYASRRFNMSESAHSKTKTNDLKEMGYNSIMPPLKASNVKIQDPFGAEFITQDLPCKVGEARILMVLDPLNGSMGQFMVPWHPWVPSKIGPRGPPIAPTDRRTPKTKKRPKKAIKEKTPSFHPRPKKGYKIKIHQELP
ncbi:hypothetical protein O181_033091 [Austropuccinia psidii MF-1]|uniref:Uncharacterized protein n=1 Tax=Austropuccinia psidii MF-1 TaxID=1389203 RepID=A0A9Q3H6R7_9BASI|nr:hypothetical protein [Austropuccinia psidii MF-1]